MAFDMYFGEAEHEAIGHHEEFLFSLVQEHEDRYPELTKIWEAFYDGPTISAHQSGHIVHELIELLASNGGLTNKSLASAVVRLLPFFSSAYRGGKDVRCSSD